MKFWLVWQQVAGEGQEWSEGSSASTAEGQLKADALYFSQSRQERWKNGTEELRRGDLTATSPGQERDGVSQLLDLVQPVSWDTCLSRNCISP